MWRNYSTQFLVVVLVFCLFFFIGISSGSPQEVYMMTPEQRAELIQAFQTLEQDNNRLQLLSTELRSKLEQSEKILASQELSLRTSLQHLNEIGNSLGEAEKSLKVYTESMNRQLTEKKIELWVWRVLAVGLTGIIIFR